MFLDIFLFYIESHSVYVISVYQRIFGDHYTKERIQSKWMQWTMLQSR